MLARRGIGMRGLRLASAAVLFLASAWAHAVRPVPPLSGPVIDEAHLLDARVATALGEELRKFPPQVQLQIWIMPSLDGEPIEAAGIRAADTWKLGTAKEDRGAILLVSVQDRRARIEIGQGLEGEIPDTLSARFIDGILVPAFRAGRYEEGIRGVAYAIYQQAGGNPSTLGYNDEAARVSSRSRRTGADVVLLIVVFIAILLLSFLRGGGRGSRFRGGGWGGGGWGGGGFGGGGFGGGSSGGGGGWSGGGGGFSGGGSSGNW